MNKPANNPTYSIKTDRSHAPEPQTYTETILRFRLMEMDVLDPVSEAARIADYKMAGIDPNANWRLTHSFAAKVDAKHEALRRLFQWRKITGNQNGTIRTEADGTVVVEHPTKAWKVVDAGEATTVEVETGGIF